MEHFAGLDVSVKQTSVCIVDGTGRLVREAADAWRQASPEHRRVRSDLGCALEDLFDRAPMDAVFSVGPVQPCIVGPKFLWRAV